MISEDDVRKGPNARSNVSHANHPLVNIERKLEQSGLNDDTDADDPEPKPAEEDSEIKQSDEAPGDPLEPGDNIPDQPTDPDENATTAEIRALSNKERFTSKRLERLMATYATDLTNSESSLKMARERLRYFATENRQLQAEFDLMARYREHLQNHNNVRSRQIEDGMDDHRQLQANHTALVTRMDHNSKVEMCVLCFTTRRCVVLWPCRHLCLCEVFAVCSFCVFPGDWCG